METGGGGEEQSLAGQGLLGAPSRTHPLKLFIWDLPLLSSQSPISLFFLFQSAFSSSPVPPAIPFVSFGFTFVLVIPSDSGPFNQWQITAAAGSHLLELGTLAGAAPPAPPGRPAPPRPASPHI